MISDRINRLFLRAFPVTCKDLTPEMGGSLSYFQNAQCLPTGSGRGTESKGGASRYTWKEDLKVFCKTQNSGLRSKEEKPRDPISQSSRCNTQEGLLSVAQTGD